ncbi:MAG: hypothetical protein EOO28_32755, partial [Comamonadaceae bacterium]
MMNLQTPADAVDWLRAHVTGTLQSDSRKVGRGDGFIAWPGAATDGRRYVPSALAQGAGACLIELDGAESWSFTDPAIAAYAQLKAATGPIAAAWFGQPTDRLDVLAVTGTNGKTSTAWWLAQALGNAGRRAGVQRGRAADAPHDGCAAGHGRQAADRGECRGRVVLMM